MLLGVDPKLVNHADHPSTCGLDACEFHKWAYNLPTEQALLSEEKRSLLQGLCGSFTDFDGQGLQES